MMEIRKAAATDHEAIWEIFSYVIKPGDTYAYDPATSMEGMMEYWLAPIWKPLLQLVTTALQVLIF